MQALGYSLTWQTRCFISGGCGQGGLFGHTNGNGDFVLFDSLGWPWPIHDCYVRRFDLDPNTAVIQVRGTRGVAVDGVLARTWETVREVSADLNQHRNPFSIIGTITNIEKRFLSRTPEFRSNLNRNQKRVVDQTFGSCRDFIVVVSGDGLEYGCFVDLAQTPAEFQDTVAIKIKAVRLLNKDVFISRNLKTFRFEE